jgi:hypothetical protein
MASLLFDAAIFAGGFFVGGLFGGNFKAFGEAVRERARALFNSDNQPPPPGV